MSGILLKLPGPTLMGGSLDVDGEPLRVGVSRVVIEADVHGVTTLVLTVPVASWLEVVGRTAEPVYVVEVEGYIGTGTTVRAAVEKLLDVMPVDHPGDQP